MKLNLFLHKKTVKMGTRSIKHMRRDQVANGTSVFPYLGGSDKAGKVYTVTGSRETTSENAVTNSTKLGLTFVDSHVVRPLWSRWNVHDSALNLLKIGHTKTDSHLLFLSIDQSLNCKRASHTAYRSAKPSCLLDRSCFKTYVALDEPWACLRDDVENWDVWGDIKDLTTCISYMIM